MTYDQLVAECERAGITRCKIWESVTPSYSAVIIFVPKDQIYDLMRIVDRIKTFGVQTVIFPLRWWECRIRRYQFRSFMAMNASLGLARK